MFGLKSSVLLGGALAVSLAGIGGFFVGKDYGKDSVMSDWNAARAKDAEERVVYLDLLSNTLKTLGDANTELAEKVRVVYVDKVERDTQIRYQNRDVIKEVFTATPFLSKGWVYAHNQLVDGANIDPAVAADRTPSEFTEADSLEAISENYSIARQAKAKDEAWNEYYEGVRANYDAASSSVQNNRDEARDSTSAEGSD